jgi:HD-GYP domain-containing protein (c-di-GMP phosphodiesterase class II)
MSDTQALLGKITALRLRLQQAQGLAHEAGSAVVSLLRDGANPDHKPAVLERQAALVSECDWLLDDALKQLPAGAAPAPETPPMPAQLTARARRVLERGRDLVSRLRTLAEGLDLPAATDPLAGLHRETLAMAETALRMVQAFPNAPSVQLRLCEGLEAILTMVMQRLGTLAHALNRRRQELAQMDKLADLLQGLHAGRWMDIQPFQALAEALVAEARQQAPLRLPHTESTEPARFVACHSLAVARVIARVVRHDPELRGRPREAVLAALLHDVGMLGVPAEVLTHAGPLDDSKRRAVEGHSHAGALLVQRLLPSGAWLAEAVATHHERLDGTGYPGGLRDLQLTALPRLLAVCDVYAALCEARLHRDARESRTALADTLLLAEQGALDRQACERLLQLSFYPVGSVVELADGMVGSVVATPAGKRDLNTPARPVVALLADPQGKLLASPRYLDLAQCDSGGIVRTLTPQERNRLLGHRYPEMV